MWEDNRAPDPWLVQLLWTGQLVADRRWSNASPAGGPTWRWVL